MKDKEVDLNKISPITILNSYLLLRRQPSGILQQGVHSRRPQTEQNAIQKPRITIVNQVFKRTPGYQEILQPCQFILFQPAFCRTQGWRCEGEGRILRDAAVEGSPVRGVPLPQPTRNRAGRVSRSNAALSCCQDGRGDARPPKSYHYFNCRLITAFHQGQKEHLEAA